MSMKNFINAVTVTNLEYHKEKLEYVYFDEDGKEAKGHVWVGVRKRAPASVLDSNKGFGNVDPFDWVATMVFLLADDGETVVLTPEQVKAMDALTFKGLNDLINKHHAKGQKKGKS